MNIGITCYPTVGGSGILSTELGKALADRGHKIHFITSSIPVRLAGASHPNIFFHPLRDLEYPVFKNPLYTLPLAAKMNEVATEFKLDIIHAHYAIPHSASAFIAGQMSGGKTKTVTTLHGTDVTLVGSAEGFVPITKFFIEKSHGVTAVSRHLRDATARIFSTDKHIEVIYNFVETEVFRPEPNPALRKMLAPGGEKIMIHVSNFRPVKCVVDTVRVFERVRREVPAILVFAGEGVETYASRQMADSLGVTPYIRFLGVRDDVENILPACDLFIINSIKESFGLAVLEAASCGVPAVSSSAGGLPEVVEEGVTGFVSPINDIPHMAKRAVQILSDEPLRKKMSENARKRAVEKFDIEKIVPLYEEFYRKVMEEG